MKHNSSNILGAKKALETLPPEFCLSLSVLIPLGFIPSQINGNDDSGVISGNWSGSYTGGRDPTHSLLLATRSLPLHPWTSRSTPAASSQLSATPVTDTQAQEHETEGSRAGRPGSLAPTL